MPDAGKFHEAHSGEAKGSVCQSITGQVRVSRQVHQLLCKLLVGHWGTSAASAAFSAFLAARFAFASRRLTSASSSFTR